MSVRHNAEISRRVRRRSTRILRNMNSADALDVDSYETVVLTFRTFEERLRRLRVKASKTDRWSSFDANPVSDSPFSNSVSDSPFSDRKSFNQDRLNEPKDRPSDESLANGNAHDMHVELRTLHNSIFCFCALPGSCPPAFPD